MLSAQLYVGLMTCLTNYCICAFILYVGHKRRVWGPTHRHALVHTRTRAYLYALGIQKKTMNPRNVDLAITAASMACAAFVWVNFIKMVRNSERRP